MGQIDFDAILAEAPAQENIVEQENQGVITHPKIDVDEILSTQNEIDHQAVSVFAEGDSDKAVKINQLSQHFQESPSVIAQDLDSRTKQYWFDVSAKQLENSSALREWSANNPQIAPVVKKDIPALANFEKCWQVHNKSQELPQEYDELYGEYPDYRYEERESGELNWFMEKQKASFAGAYSGELQNKLGKMWEQARKGEVPIDDEFKAKSKQMDEELSALEEHYGDSGFVFNTSQVLGQMTDSFSTFGSEMAEGAVQASAFGAVGSGVAATAGVAGAAAFTPLLAFAGAGAVYGSTRAVEAGLAYKELMEGGVPDEKARTIAGAVGTVNGLIEALGDIVIGGIAGSSWGAVKGKLMHGISAKTAKALQEKGMLEVVGNVAKGWSAGVSTEVLTEILQEVVGISGEEVGRIWGETGKEGITPDEVQDRLVEIGVKTFQAASVLGFIGAGPVLTHQIRQVHEAQARGQRMLDLAESMKQVEAVKTAPEVVGQAVQHIANNVQAPTVYIDGQAFAQTLIDKKVSLEELQKTVPEVAQQVTEAVKNGGDVRIPMGDYAVKIAPTELGESLAEHIRTEEDQLSAREAVQVESAYKGLIKDALNDPQAVQERAANQLDNAFKEETKAIEQQYLEELKQKFPAIKARTQAKLGALVVSNLARRAGLKPEQVKTLAPNLVMSEQTQEGLKQNPQERLDLLNKSREFDEQLRLWEQGKGKNKFNFGTPSWVLQIFGVPKTHPITTTKRQMIHVLLPANKILLGTSGKHGIKPEEIRGILVGIQRPIAVFKSATEKNSLVLLTELTRDGEQIVAPILVKREVNGELKVVNFLPSIHERRDSQIEGWINKGLLLGYEKTKGVELLSNYHQFNSGRHVRDFVTESKPSDNHSTPLDDVIVYENDTSIGDVYQNRNNPRGSYSPSQNQISLSFNADLSTFSHEIGHWYLENLLQLSKFDEANATVKEDAVTILKTFGLSDVNVWDSLNAEDKRKYHEQFAYQVEVYLATGKAPTPSLQGFFARLGKWITDVYRQFTDSVFEQRSAQFKEEFGEELPEISPELKRVLDRMVASENLLKQSEAAESLRPLFETKPEDMDEQIWNELQAVRSLAESEGVAAIQQVHAKDEKWYTNARSKELKKLQREAKKLRDEVKAKVETAVRNKPVYVTLEILKSGGKALGMDNLKMDPQALKDAGFNDEEITKLRNLGVVKKGGFPPSATRELLKPYARFKSDGQMVRQLINARPINEVIEEETTNRCLQKNSALFDPVKLDELVTKALHTQARERMVAHELRYLAGNMGMNTRMAQAAAKKAAQVMIDSMPLGEARVRTFMSLESKASRKAFEALRKGDRKAAASAKYQQLLYANAVRIATDLQNEIDWLRNLRAKIFQADKKLRKTHDVNILSVARYVLSNHGLGKVSASKFEPLAALRYVERLEAYDPEKFAAFSAVLNRHGFNPNQPDIGVMSVQDVRSLIADVEFLWGKAKEEKVYKLDEQKLSREEVINTLLDQANSLGLKAYNPGRHERVTEKEKASFSIMGLKAKMRRVESWCLSMDAGNANTPFRKYIYDPVAKAAADYRIANAEIQEKLVKLIAPLKANWDSSIDIEAPEIGYVFRSKSELIGAILHTGNESNKQKLLLGGRGDEMPWADVVELPDGSEQVDTRRWDGFVQRCYTEGIITKQDMDFVQAVWDTLESIKPKAQKAFYEMYGYYFEEIPAQAIETPWGTYKGGYVPAMTDRYLVAEKSTQDEINRITETEYMTMMPVSRPGFSVSRVAGYRKPLSLDLSQLCGHVQKTLQFAYIAPASQEVGKILNNREFSDWANSINPHWLPDLLAPWLKRSYHQRLDDGKSDSVSRLLGKYRALAGMSIMAGNVVNAAQQITGFSIALTKIKASSMAVAMKRLMLERGQLYEQVTELSPFMQGRLRDRAFEYQSKLQKLASTQGRVLSQKGAFNKAQVVNAKLDPLRNWIGRHAYFLQTAMQAPIDLIVWTAAFDEAVAKGMTDQEAVAHADSVVRTTQSSFAPEDIASVESGNALVRAFLVFYNYFGMQYNLLAERKANADLKPFVNKYGSLTLDAIAIVFIPAVLAKVLENALRGELGGDDDEEWEAIDWIQLVIGEPIKNFIAMIPFAGSLTNTVGAGFAKNGNSFAQAIFGKNPYVGKPMSSPAVDMAESAFKAVVDIYKLYDGDDVSARKMTRETLDLMTMIFGIPFGALKKPLGYGANVLEGEASTDNPVTGMLRGK